MHLDKSEFEFTLKNNLRYRITFTRSAPAPGNSFAIFLCVKNAPGCNWEYFSSGNFTGVPDLDSAEKLLNRFYKPSKKKKNERTDNNNDV